MSLMPLMDVSISTPGSIVAMVAERAWDKPRASWKCRWQGTGSIKNNLFIYKTVTKSLQCTDRPHVRRMSF